MSYGCHNLVNIDTISIIGMKILVSMIAKKPWDLKLFHLLLSDGVPIEQIGQIADFMYEWEGSVAEQLGLTRPEVAAIKKKYPEDLNLQT